MSVKAKEKGTRIDRFDHRQWLNWLTMFFDGQVPYPDMGYFGDEKCDALIRLYRTLPVQSRRAFSQAVVTALEGTEIHSDEAERLFTLLQVIAYLQPIGAKQLVRRLVINRTLADITYANQRLGLVALVTASKFEIDDELLYFMDRSLRQVDEFRALLVYLRLYSQADAHRAADFLSTIMEKLEPGVKARQAARQLQGVTLRNGCKEIYRWYAAERATNDSPEKFRLLCEEVLTHIVPSPAEWSNETDQYAVLLSASLHTLRTEFDATQLILLSQVAKNVGPDGEEAARLVRSSQTFYVVDPADPGINLIPIKNRETGPQLITINGEQHRSQNITVADALALVPSGPVN